MSWRDALRESLDTFLDLCWITASEVLGTRNDVTVTVLGDPDPDGDEVVARTEIYGHAPLIYRPQDPDTNGRCEGVMWRTGDERVILGTKDRRHQRSVEKGEALLRALGLDGARQAVLLLKPAGDVSLEGVNIIVLANEIKLGSSSASDFVALSSPTNTRLDDIAAALDTFCGTAPVANDGGAALQTAVKLVWGGSTPGVPTPAADVGATKVKAE